ncbi:hypothetical protein B0H17DRAFT_1151213 [Mycena rosella]|uniref:SAP domain-containing protein n=1 Tax=Mycena rosella TaxID=1033263 RepID=A0AAD7BMA2_MYCRO|nr:hypothetical protein B0H17DRAFT_1151213 [Mycena rosella]
MPPSAPWVEEFTLPGLNQTLGADRLIKEVQLKIINKTTTKELQAYLGSYGLPISGPNKGVLVDRLRTYANDREQGIGRKKTYSEYYIVSLLRFKTLPAPDRAPRPNIRANVSQCVVREINNDEIMTNMNGDEDDDRDQITEPRTSGGCNHTPTRRWVLRRRPMAINERLPTKISALSSQGGGTFGSDPETTTPRSRVKQISACGRIEREIKGMKSQILGVHSGISALLATESRGESPSSTALKEARESQEKSDAAAARRFFHDKLGSSRC